MSRLRMDWSADVEDAAHGIAMVGTDGVVQSVNRAACAILGVEEDQLVGCRLSGLVALDVECGERRYVRPDGGVVWLLVDTRPAEPDRLVVQLHDVSAGRWLADDERSRAGVEGSWVLDMDGRTVSVSASAAELLGRSPEDLRGRSPLEFVADEDREALQASMETRLTGVRESYEVRWRRPDGELVWTQLSAAPILDAGGRQAGAFALVTDVTERRRGEQRLERQARQQEAVASLGRLALEGADLAALYDTACRVSARVLDAPYVGVFAPRPESPLALVAAHGLPVGEARELALTVREGRRWLDRLAIGEPVVIADWELDDRLPRPRHASLLGIRGVAAIPVSGKRLHGAVVAARDSAWIADAGEVRYLEAVANVLASAGERAESEEQARHRAMHDPLTGLPNRTLLLDRLDQALRRSRTGEGQLAVVAVDLDRFKTVNDTLGIAAGDELLCAVAERLRAAVRPSDTLARLSGDSFVVICEDVHGDEGVAMLAERIVEAVRTPLRAGGEELVMTASAGVAIATGSSDDAAALLRDADAAIDRAKAQGRDRFELFDAAVRARVVARVRLERDLRGATARGELLVAYQPIVALRSGRVTGVEALVRWRHPERGVVPPADFIAVAEEAGLIGEIDAWVLRTACADVARRHRSGRTLTCHVNLAPPQAADPSFPALVDEVLAETGLPPESLVLEVTEGAMMEDGDAPLEVMGALRERGVRIVLDDFGTGYSSLSRLRAFPLDGLKIDRSFVAGLDGDALVDPLIVAGIVELARALGLTVVAEGIETPVQLARLQRIGCRYGQGFLLARPGDGEQLDALLAREYVLPDAAPA